MFAAYIFINLTEKCLFIFIAQSETLYYMNKYVFW